MKLLIVTSLLFISTVTWSRQIDVGGAKIEIPSPHGFAALTDQMQPINQLLEKTGGTTNNIRFLTFVAEDQIPKAIQGKYPDLERHFSVQVSKSLINIDVTSAEFRATQEQIKYQNDNLLRAIEKERPDFLAALRKGIDKQLGFEAAFSVAQVVPLAPHKETSFALSYAMYVGFNAKDKQGKAVPGVQVVNVTLLHIRNRLLFLYTFAGKNDLAWSRAAAERWLQAVLAANPN